MAVKASIWDSGSSTDTPRAPKRCSTVSRSACARGSRAHQPVTPAPIWPGVLGMLRMMFLALGKAAERAATFLPARTEITRRPSVSGISLGSVPARFWGLKATTSASACAIRSSSELANRMPVFAESAGADVPEPAMQTRWERL
jgi:hypothetical protein